MLSFTFSVILVLLSFDFSCVVSCSLFYIFFIVFCVLYVLELCIGVPALAVHAKTVSLPLA